MMTMLLSKSFSSTKQPNELTIHVYEDKSRVSRLSAKGNDRGQGNYTNNSPYPIFHIIRNASIENVCMNDKHAEHIVAHNIATIEGLSSESLALLKNLAKL